MSEDALTSRQREVLTKAKSAFHGEDYAQAASLLEDLYLEVQTSNLNHLLVEALYMHKEYSRARTYADDFLNSYLTNATDIRFLLTLLLRVHEFVLAHEIVAGINDTTLKRTGTDMIAGAEAEARQTTAATIKTISKQFYHMSDLSPVQQQARFQAALKLPLQEFETGAKFLLLDPYLHPLFVASILEVLQRVKEPTPVKFRWIDEQQYEVIPVQLTPLQEEPVYQQTQATLRQQLSEQDPVAETLLSQELRLQLTLTYPFVGRVVSDQDAWVRALIATYRGDHLVANSAVQRWQKRLDTLVNQLAANEDEN
ncbi:hypothetical protein [Furfurilactobacillus curtus]|uniref:Type I restriction endonuclease subunit R n=1 Tax=Furfurilactobacillus curtus TaxID=1746200 RepID=A0ABQ5JL82_9LACO